jgi:hypothetical protein
MKHLMSKNEFLSQPKPEQVHRVIKDGEELMSRIFAYYNIKLFKYADFFVEIWYQQVSNTIDKVVVVDDDDVLHLYDKKIDISDLFR